MKKSYVLATLAIVFMSLLTTSCKKSDILEPTTNVSISKTNFQPPKVDDLKAYLIDFKQQMQNRGNNETMELDEAAWHLSSIANYDFGDVVSCFDNFHTDTLYYNINVQNGKTSMYDLNTLYTQMTEDITSYLKNLDLENKHIRFIGVDISDTGLVVLSILVSYGWIDHQWYFPNMMTLYSTLSPYFDDYYTCDYEIFTDTLKNVLNLLTTYRSENHPGRVSLIVMYTVNFNYYNYPDPYSTYYLGYRIFANYIRPQNMGSDDFFYYFDSYAGLAADSCNHGLTHYDIIDYQIIDQELPGTPYSAYHLPSVRYGIVVFPEDPTPPLD